MKKSIAMILAFILLLGILPAAADEDVVRLTVWMPKGEDSVYYADYSLNPVIQYVRTKTWSDGRKVELEFFVPISGEEKNSFNTYLSTGQYCGMMNLSYSDYSVDELYRDGIARDLTEYIEDCMPNYLAWLENNPDIVKECMTLVDGEWKYLCVCGCADKPSKAFEGYLYRRDWIVKYGSCPEYIWDAESDYVQENGHPLYPVYSEADSENDWTGWKENEDYEEFWAEYGDDPDNTYIDNVIFPSGTEEPLYISDWEWMMEIFAQALEDLGVSDGYPLALVYNGYTGCGDLVSSFGGGVPHWGRTPDNECVFGGTTDNFRTYLECLATWYDRGWIEPGFDQHSGDMFYAVNTTKTHMGKVGLWQGRLAEIGCAMDVGSELTEGIVAFGCKLPINDVYGGPEQQNKIPDSFYQFSKINSSHIITTAVPEEDIPTILEMLDFFYSEEGTYLACGLNAEQLAQIPDPSLYERFGIDSAYTIDENGMGHYHKALCEDTYLRNACLNNRWFGHGNRFSWNADTNDSKLQTYSIGKWDAYENTGYKVLNAIKMFDSEQSAQYSKTSNYLITFFDVNVVKFIKGQSDITDDDDWAKFCKSVNKYRPEIVTGFFNTAFEELYGQ